MRTKRPVMNIIIIAALRARAAKPYHLKTGGYGPAIDYVSMASYYKLPSIIFVD